MLLIVGEYMQTRIQRHNYSDEILDNVGRTKKNASLYKQDYTTGEIKVPKVSNGRELNEDEFQKIINQSKTRSMKVITTEEEKYEEPNLEREEKVYDINSVLEKAKNRRKDNSIPKYKIPVFEECISVEEDESNLDLLSDLIGDDNTIVTSKLVDDTIIDDITETKIDESFYSKSLKFDRKDFVESDISVKTKKNSNIQIIITVVIVVLLIIAVVLGILVLSKIKF